MGQVPCCFQCSNSNTSAAISSPVFLPLGSWQYSNPRGWRNMVARNRPERQRKVKLCFVILIFKCMPNNRSHVLHSLLCLCEYTNMCIYKCTILYIMASVCRLNISSWQQAAKTFFRTIRFMRHTKTCAV